MNERWALLLVGLVLVSGCIGTDGSEGAPGQSTVTAAPTWAETETATNERILAVHREALANQSYRLSRVDSTLGNATATITSAGYHVRRNGSVTRLVTNGTQYRHAVTETERRTYVSPADDRSPRWITAALARGESTTFETNGTITRDGRELRVYRALGLQDVEVRLLVDRRGVVRSYELSTTGSGQERLILRYRVLDGGGHELADPDWRDGVRSVGVSDNDSFLRYVNTTAGLRMRLRGPRGHLGTVRTREPPRLMVHDTLNRSRVSPLVGVVSPFDTDTQRIVLAYEESEIPDGGSESELQLYAYNRTHQFYFPVESRVDAENDVVVGNRTQSITFTYQNGTKRTVRGSLDPSSAPYLVVLHTPTWRESF